MEESDLFRRINYHGHSIGGASNLIRIEPDELISIAITTTGLDNFGEDNWKPYYYDYVERLNGANKLHTLGRLRLKMLLINGLRNRLLIANEIKNQPDIVDEPIDRPIIIIGPPRSGTTILFALLSQDPKFRSPLGFEVVSPIAPPHHTVTGGVSRKEISQCVFDIEMDIHKGLRAMHDHSHTLPAECYNIMANVLAFFDDAIIGDYKPRHEEQNNVGRYRWHKKVLQLLQLEQPGMTWLLKSPSHIRSLELILETYPDACLVHTHRNPLAIVPSVAKLLEFIVKSYCDVDDFSTFLQTYLSNLEVDLRKSIKQRQEWIVPETNIFDVYFDDIMLNPVEIIKQIYRKFGINFNKQNEVRILDYLAANPRHKHGKYCYKNEDFYLADEQISKKFELYTAYYGLDTTTS